MSFADLAFSSPAQTNTERFLLLAVKSLTENAIATTTGIPEFPLVLAGEIADTAVVLSWSPVAGAKRYQVYRGITTNFSESTLISTIEEQGTISTRSFSDIADQIDAPTLYYWVRGIDDADEGPISNVFETSNPTLETGGGMDLPFNGPLGDGRDGDLTISSNTTATNEIPIYQFEDLTINSGVSWVAYQQNPGGFMIAVRGRLTIAGTIQADGLGGAINPWQSGDTIGRSGYSGYNFGGAGGGGGFSGAVTIGGMGGPVRAVQEFGGYDPGGFAPATGNTQWNYDSATADKGSVRGQSGVYLASAALGGDSSNGADGSNIADAIDVNLFPTLWAFRRQAILGGYGASGGAGASDGVLASGTGGAGGGYIIILCEELDFQATGVLSARGIAGGSTSTTCGAGGGGGGGTILIGYRTLINNLGTVNVTGGAGGIGSGAGTDGGDGGNGFSKIFDMRV